MVVPTQAVLASDALPRLGMHAWETPYFWLAVRGFGLGGGGAGRYEDTPKADAAAFQLSETCHVDRRRGLVVSAVDCGVDGLAEAHGEPPPSQLDNRSGGFPIRKCLTD